MVELKKSKMAGETLSVLVFLLLQQTTDSDTRSEFELGPGDLAQW